VLAVVLLAKSNASYSHRWEGRGSKCPIPSNEARIYFLPAEQTPGFCLEGLFEEAQCQPPKTPPTWSLKALLKCKNWNLEGSSVPRPRARAGAALHHPRPCRYLAQIYPLFVEIMPLCTNCAQTSCPQLPTRCIYSQLAAHSSFP
jgi:hypothetical protein